MGGSVNKVAFGPLVNLVSDLVRSMLTPHIDASAETFILYRNERDMNQPKTPLIDPPLISQEALDFFTNEDFVSIVMSNAYEPTDFGEALAHVC